ADQEVGAQADSLPENKRLEEIVRAHVAQHAGGEEADFRIVAWLALLLVHVAERVDENQETEERDEDEHQRAQVVDQQRDLDRVLRKEDRDPDESLDRLRRESAAEASLLQDLDEHVQ